MRELRITNLEPLILDPDTGISNERDTLDYIPASRLRGAFYAALPQIARGIQAADLLGYDGPRWSCAFPADNGWQPLRPRPRCSEKIKGRADRWFKYNWDGNPLEPATPKVEINMGLSRHYGRRAHRDTALYARSALSPGQQFVAWVDSDLVSLGDYRMSIGTRHSVNGLCHVKVVEPANRPFKNNRNDQRHILMLLSDAIVPGLHGGYMRGLDNEALTRELGCKAKVLAKYSSWHTVGAWSGTWGMPRESAVAIEAGSAWLVEADDLECLERCANEGIGVRRFEGYGWLELDPGYIQISDLNGIYDLVCPIDSAPSVEHPEQTHVHWPSIEQMELGELEKILKDASKERLPDDPAELKRKITTLTRAPNADPKDLFLLHVLLEQSKSKKW